MYLDQEFDSFYGPQQENITTYFIFKIYSYNLCQRIN